MLSHHRRTVFADHPFIVVACGNNHHKVIFFIKNDPLITIANTINNTYGFAIHLIIPYPELVAIIARIVP